MRRKLTPQDALAVTNLLSADMVKYSPMIGLLACCSTSLIGNLRKSTCNTISSELAKDFFNQREVNGQRFGPLAVTRSKSKPSYWLTSQDLGHILGFAISKTDMEVLYYHFNLTTQISQGNMKSDDIDKFLKTINIECNYFNGMWTGISLERYRRIIRMLAKDIKLNSSFNSPLASSKLQSLPLSIPVYMRLLWEKADTKLSLLEFILALEASSGQQMIDSLYSDIRQPNSAMQLKWISNESIFDNTERHYSSIQSQLDDSINSILKTFCVPQQHIENRLDPSISTSSSAGILNRHINSQDNGLYSVPGNYSLITFGESKSSKHQAEDENESVRRHVEKKTDENNEPTTTVSNVQLMSTKELYDMELLSLSLANIYSFKPAIKLGRYSYRNSKHGHKPDCVEVAIREIIDYFIYGKTLHNYIYIYVYI